MTRDAALVGGYLLCKWGLTLCSVGGWHCCAGAWLEILLIFEEEGWGIINHGFHGFCFGRVLIMDIFEVSKNLNMI